MAHRTDKRQRVRRAGGQRTLRVVASAAALGVLLPYLLAPAPAGAFAPSKLLGLGSNSHQSITESVIEELDRAFFSVPAPTKTMRKAIAEIVDANELVDKDQLNSEKHFDGENFAGGQRRVVDAFNLIISDLKAGNGRLARFQLGGALHTIQDFYSHTNWVELGNTGPSADLGRPGRTLGPVAGPTEVTCAGSTITTTKLTSGYYGGEDRVAPIPGKCRHGGPFDDSPGTGGINKDSRNTTLSPHANRHDDAARLAAAGTRQFIEDIRARVTMKELKLLLGAGPTLGMSIDTTGSMEDIINGVKDQAIRIVDSRLDTDEEPSRYVLAPFNDPVVGNALATDDAEAFKSAIASLPASGGDDCPELSMTGALRALAQMDEGGDLFLFTDASSKDGGLAGNVSGLAAAKDIAVYPMVFGSCSPLDPAYVRLANETGGQVFDLARQDAEAITELADFLVRSNAVHVLSATGELTGTPRQFDAPVDSAMSRVTFSVTGTRDVTIRRPDGSAVAPDDPGVRFVPLSGDSGPAAIVTVAEPAAGGWRVAVAGEGPFSLAVSGESPVDLARLRFIDVTGRPGHEGAFELPGWPGAGRETTVDAALTAGIVDPRFELRDAEGATLRTLDLAPADEVEFFGPLTPPDDAFRVYLTGTDADGAPVQRTVRGLERAQPVVVEPPDDGADLPAGRPTSYTFRVRNLGAADTFTLTVADDLGFPVRARPASVFLGRGAAAKVTVTVRPPCPAQRALETVTLTATSRRDADVTNFGAVSGAVVATAARRCPSGPATRPPAARPPAADGLPITGASMPFLLGLAAALIAGGTALLLLWSRHRRPRLRA